MAENTADDLNLAAAQAAGRLLERCVPEHAAVLTPYVLRLFAALQNGHSFVWLDEGEAEELAGLAPTVGQGASPLVLQGRKLFLGRMWQLEHDLAAEIERLAEAEVEPVDWMSASQNLSCWFADKGSEGQRDAAGLALLQTFMLITGGPGTGKTTTVAKLLGLICTNSSTRLPHIALAAPTGKAAAHMARALHRAVDGFEMPDAVRNHLSALEGQTVHRLLKLRPPQMQPQFDADNPLPLDILIIDEASMLDLALMLNLLRAVPAGTRVVLTADHGMVDTDADHRVTVTDHPDLVRDVTAVAGEPRLTSLCVRGSDPDLAHEVARRWRDHLGQAALWVGTREQSAALLGPLSPRARGVVGDVLVAMAGSWVVVDPRVHAPAAMALPGVHGSLTRAETSVPLLVRRA